MSILGRCPPYKESKKMPGDERHQFQVSILGRSPTYKESKKMTGERKGRTLGVLRKVSAL